jgi:hypothetical protein
MRAVVGQLLDSSFRGRATGPLGNPAEGLSVPPRHVPARLDPRLASTTFETTSDGGEGAGPLP